MGGRMGAKSRNFVINVINHREVGQSPILSFYRTLYFSDQFHNHLPNYDIGYLYIFHGHLRSKFIQSVEHQQTKWPG